MSAKDARLYAKFTLDFPDHSKIAPLSSDAFRCLIEATMWSRKHMTDGFLARRLALARWSLSVLQELSTNDPENPSLIEREEGWYIHDFDLHQDTRAEIEARQERNKAAGRKGGLARSKRLAKRGAKRVASEVPSENLAETETETHIGTNVVGSSPTETSTELTLVGAPTKSVARKASRRRTVPDGWMPSDAERARSRERYPDVDLRKELDSFIDYHQGKGSLFADLDAAWRTWLRNTQRFSTSAAQTRKGPDGKVIDWAQLMNRMNNQPNTIEGAIEQ